MGGRTARMMEQAIAVASQGETVLVVTPDEQTASRLRAEYRMACEILGESLRIESVKDAATKEPRGSPSLSPK